MFSALQWKGTLLLPGGLIQVRLHLFIPGMPNRGTPPIPLSVPNGYSR